MFAGILPVRDVIEEDNYNDKRSGHSPDLWSQ